MAAGATPYPARHKRPPTVREQIRLPLHSSGKTRCINHFLINDSWYLVDLPGYGHASTSKTNVQSWNAFTREYFVDRETLVCVMLLVDSSIPPMLLDVQAAAWFEEANVRSAAAWGWMGWRAGG